MALWRNKSNGPITFYNPLGAFQTPIPPGHVVSDADHPKIAGHPDFAPVEDFWTFANEFPRAKIALVRSYALGDVLMVYAILQTLKPRLQELGTRVALFTERRFHAVFAHDPWLIWGVDQQLALIPDVQRKFDVAFSLNGVLERDHAEIERNQENRLHMLAVALGVEDVIQT